MICDGREEVRRQAVMWIKQARDNFNPADHPRQFVPPDVKFEASDYTKMIDWDKVPCTEPPLTYWQENKNRNNNIGLYLVKRI